METTIDEVSIQIESNSNNAASGLDKLTESLQKLNGITSVTIPNLNKLNSTINTLKNNSQGLSKLQKNLEGTSKASKNIDTSNMEKLKISMSKSIDASKNFSVLKGHIQEITNASNNISGFEKLKNSIAGIKTGTLERLKGIFNGTKNNAEKMNKSLKNTPSSLSKIATFASGVGTGFKKVAKITSTIKEGISRVFNFKGLSSGFFIFVYCLFTFREDSIFS